MNTPVLIRNGTVVDGTRALPRQASVAVSEGHIAAVGDPTRKCLRRRGSGVVEGRIGSSEWLM